MFTVSMHLTRRGLAFVAAIIVLAVAGGIWMRAARADLQGQTISDSAVQTIGQLKIEKCAAQSNEQRIAFLASFGWQAEEEPEEIADVLIPNTFDDVYERYNALQKEQGCDLKRYAGRRCKRYSYAVKNYPDEEHVRANLLVYDGRIIGGDICSLRLDGFMHGFAREDE